MAGITIVFDFDKTIIDVDSDNWIVDEFGFTDLFNELLPTTPWNSLMDRILMEVHAQGKTMEDMKEVLNRVPIHPRILSTIKTAHALGCDLRIVSDANVFFIDTIIDRLGIKDCFSEINSNPNYVDEEGSLRISPFIDLQSSPHGCTLCPANMCKGMIIGRIQESLAKEGKQGTMIYVGDGIGDFCPSLKLRDCDFMMPRKNFPAWELICEHRELLRAEVHEWVDGEDMEKVVLMLIEKRKIHDSVNNFKIETMPIGLQPHSLKVHH